MRVAHIITRLILGGAQENTLLTCEGLIERYGDNVLLVTGPAVGPEGSLMERAESRGVPIELVPSLRRAIHPWHDAVALRQLKRVLREFKPDVVHTHSAKAGILGRAAATALDVPAVVHTVHGAPFYPYQGRAVRLFYQACERWAAKRCHALISVADAMTSLMVDAGVAPAEKFTTIYSGMDVEPFLAAEKHRGSARAALGYEDHHVVIGKVARLFHLKGHEYVIQAARSVIDRHPNARFLFVGDGILRENLQRQIASRGLTDYFQFTGLVPPGRIPELISAMDIVVHASLREGLARVLPQAMISGVPVVSYDVDGAREVILPGETGFLLPAKAIDEMAEALDELISEPQLRRALGQEGRRRWTEMFRHEHMTDEIRKLYEKVLEERGFKPERLTTPPTTP